MPGAGSRTVGSRLLRDVLELDAVDARAAGELGFMARILVQATLPHSRPSSHEFERVNGRYTLDVHAPASIGLPYGSYPRLVLAWLTTEAVRKRNPEIHLGPNLSHFMYRLGLTPVTGKRGTTHRLRDQLHRLFSTTIRWTYSDEQRGRTSGRGYVIAGEHHLWWAPEDSSEQPGWPSRVVLGREFFEEIRTSPVPVDLRALRLLRSSPLALDIYCWLTYRLSYLQRPCLIPWAALERQFGSDYCRPRDFRRRFVEQLGRVLKVYPAARISQTDDALLLRPSPSHVPRRAPQAS